MVNSLAHPRWPELSYGSVTKVTNRRAIRHATVDGANSAIYSGCILRAGAAKLRWTIPGLFHRQFVSSLLFQEGSEA